MKTRATIQKTCDTWDRIRRGAMVADEAPAANERLRCRGNDGTRELVSSGRVYKPESEDAEHANFTRSTIGEASIPSHILPVLKAVKFRSRQHCELKSFYYPTPSSDSVAAAPRTGRNTAVLAEKILI